MNFKWIPLLFILTKMLLAGDLPESLYIQPYLQNVSQSSIVIMWKTTESCQGEIQYGLSIDQMTLSQKESSSKKLHEIKLKGLEVGQSYYYRCLWDEEKTKTWQFKTSPTRDEENIKIVTYGDSRSNPKVHHQIAQLVAEEKPDLILHSGDFVMYGDDEASWKPEFFDPIAPFGPEVPILTVLGNHERNAVYYYNFYALNNNEAWWSQDYGPVHIIGLDSNQPGEPGTEQYEWLVNDLETHQDAKWIIAMFHHPLFNANKWRDTYYLRWHWHPLFEKYNVDIVINGDDHYYYRSLPIGLTAEEQNGVTYIISAGGGAPLYPTTHEDYVAQRRSIYHYTVFDIQGDHLIGRAVNVDGKVFDTWGMHKDEMIAPESFISYEMILLEEALKKQFSVSWLQEENGKMAFSCDFVLPTSFQIPVQVNVRWESGTQWFFKESNITHVIQPGESIPFQFSGIVPFDQMVPLPALRVDIEGLESERWEDVRLPTGFKNTNIRLNLENAFYQAIKDQNSAFTNYADAIQFLNYFPESQYAEAIKKYFFETVQSEDLASPSIIKNIEKLIKSAQTPQAESVYYPMMFLLGDFSQWDMWLNMVHGFKLREREPLRKNLIALSESEKVSGGAINNWYVLGSFENTDDKGFDAMYPPENTVDLDTSYPGVQGESIHWKKMKLNAGNQFDFNQLFKEHEYGIVYCYTTIKSLKDTVLPLLLGSDDGIVVWINGQEIYRHNEARGVVPGQDFLFAEFNQGANELLIKVSQKGGGWGVSAHILDKENVLTFIK
ncbi:metallophosphoesterase family protein [candidate division KSB1 bacterium]|nr:metallophosphoesterase family protein [candidate division KSB1 bacterium]